jgi:hypothetical protein
MPASRRRERRCFKNHEESQEHEGHEGETVRPCGVRQIGVCAFGAKSLRRSRFPPFFVNFVPFVPFVFTFSEA